MTSQALADAVAVASSGKANLAQLPFARLGGLETVRLTRAGLAQEMVRDCLEARRIGAAARPKLVFSSNGQGLALVRSSPEFMAVMSQADIVHADGMPVVAFSKMTKSPLPERIATTDFFHDAAAAAAKSGLRFFVLGASEDQNRRAVECMQRLYPDLQIVGRHNGFFTEAEEEAVLEKIVAARTDVLWVALGKPKQEYWSAKVRDKLPGVGWIKTCGGLYAFLAGDAPRAPGWMQRLSLEWFYRAVQEPLRLGPRYAATNLAAVLQLIKNPT